MLEDTGAQVVSGPETVLLLPVKFSLVQLKVTEKGISSFLSYFKDSLPVSISMADRGMVTLFPVSLSVTVSPVMDPSSGTSLEVSHDARRPPRHFPTHTVLVL